ncbi:MAG TPA: hypothetical protein VI215_04200 [Bacteroidota bacterium]|jgi:hypothetical protein
MGQQQLLLVILGIIIVGIAISVGVTQFGAHSQQANKDGVTESLVAISANAYQFKIRPSTMGGGSNSFVGYAVPTKMSRDDNGFLYVTGTVTASSCEIQGTSTINTNWVASCVVDDSGKTTITYVGW